MTNKEWIMGRIENSESYQIALAYCDTVSDCDECETNICSIYDINSWMKEEHIDDK